MKRKTRSSSSTATAAERKSKKTKTKNGAELSEVSTTTKLDLSSPEKLFASLIAPTTPEDFFNDFWEKKPLLIQREDPEFYGAVFSKAYLEVLLKKEEINFVEDINVCRYVDGEKELLNGEEGAKATAAKVLKEVKDNKATIQFHQPQRFQDIIWQVCGNLEKLFGCLVGANVYITPPEAQGLAPHYDDVEVFIFQLEGEKNWKLYSPPVELPQDYSADLEQDSIGKPTHEFTLKAGDMVYFPRGTIHQAETLKCKSHSTHITLSTYQQNSWGNFISTALTQAIDNAIDLDKEFRKGLPINFLNYIGLGMDDAEGTDEKAIATKKEKEGFKKQLKELLIKLVDHVDASGTADKLARDFIASRLPPYNEHEEKEDGKKEESEKPPTEDSEVKFRYPEYVRITAGDAAPTSPMIALADVDTDGDEESDDEKDGSSMDDEMESEEEPKTKKGAKSKQVENGKKAGKKGKKDKKSEDEDDEEVSVKKAGKKGAGKAAEPKGKKGKQGKKASEAEDEEMSEENGAKKGKKTEKKGKKGKDDSEEDEESDNEFEIGTEDTASSEESDDDDSDTEEDEGNWVLVHHAVNNDHTQHMMGMQEPSILKFAVTYQDALLHLYHKRHEYIPIKSLPLDLAEAQYLVNSLWAEGLILVK